MNWLPGFTAPLAGLLFLLTIPLVILYFLKLKRPRLEIASLALWRSVLDDQRVNSPFQKFRRNILLLLQLLVLSLLCLAAMQPFVRGGAQQARYLPILIDVSASMAAVDEQGRSRLDVAKDEIEEIIENLLSDQRVALIAVGQSARALTEFTDNKRLLLDTLRDIEVLDVPSRLEDGMRMTQALALTAPIEKVHLFSDGNFPTTPAADGAKVALVDFDLPFELEFHRLPSPQRNIGITAFNARRSGTKSWDVFVRAEASSAGGQVAGDVQLFADDEAIGTENVLLQPGDSERLVFRFDTEDAASLRARLEPSGGDSLPSDNEAFLELPQPRPLTVYCAADLAAFRHALGVLEDITLYPDADVETPDELDLVISNDLTHQLLDAHTYIFVNVIPEDLKSLVEIEPGFAEIVDWKRDSALLRHVLLKGVQITDQPSKKEGIEDGDFETLGYETLAYGNSGPLILRRRDADQLSFFLLFDPDTSTLPYRVGFPVMIANAVNVALEQASLSEVRGVQTGVLPPIEGLVAGERYTIESPDGSTDRATASDTGVIGGVAARSAGSYEVRRGGDVARRLGVGLLSGTETSLFSVEEIQFKETPVEAGTATLATNKPLWPLLALLAFTFLLVEWWYFQRRPVAAT